MARCKSCGREIYYLRTMHGKLAPVDASTVEGHGIKSEDEITKHTMFNVILHTTHFVTCPDANRFRKPKGKK